MKGADTGVKSKEGNTPLDLASLSFDENDSFDIETKYKTGNYSHFLNQ